MKVVVLVLAVGMSILCCSDWGVAQPAGIQPAGPQGARLLGAVPPEVLPKIEQLARLLQQGINGWSAIVRKRMPTSTAWCRRCVGEW